VLASASSTSDLNAVISRLLNPLATISSLPPEDSILTSAKNRPVETLKLAILAKGIERSKDVKKSAFRRTVTRSTVNVSSSGKRSYRWSIG